VAVAVEDRKRLRGHGSLLLGVRRATAAPPAWARRRTRSARRRSSRSSRSWP
jgi:hypothetical protein